MSSRLVSGGRAGGLPSITGSAPAGTGSTGIPSGDRVFAVFAPKTPADSTLLEESASIIRRRVSAFGLGHAGVSVQGSDLVIALLSDTNAKEILDELSAPGQLLFRPVYCELPPYAAPASASSNEESAAASPQADCSSADSAELPST